MAHEPAGFEINRGYLDHFRRWSRSGAGNRGAVASRLLYGRPAQLLFLPLLPVVAAFVGVRLLLWRTLTAPRQLPDLHALALGLVDEFVEQYPWHLYPVVAKSLELAFLKTRLSATDTSSRILEIAIGDGTLSKRVFAPGYSVTAVDLSPYDLVKAAKLGHVSRAIVCDGLNPPFTPSAYDVLVANNFLHHVTQKSGVLANWGRIARRLIFTENTRTWATGWPVPYLLRRLGLVRRAGHVADTIERQSLQHLLSLEDTVGVVSSACQIADRQSFLSERTFFYCGLFSFFLRCYGPPTPSLFKKLALGPLRPMVIPSTRLIAKLLIEFDAFQERSRDAFLEFVCDSPTTICLNPGADLMCPCCGSILTTMTKCAVCGADYPVRDGMLFLLPPELRHVAEDYRREIADTIPAEHL